MTGHRVRLNQTQPLLKYMRSVCLCTSIVNNDGIINLHYCTNDIWNHNGSANDNRTL